MKNKYVVNQKTLDQTFAIMKDFTPIEDDKIAKVKLLGRDNYLVGETDDAMIYIGAVGKDEILQIVKSDNESGVAYGPLIGPNNMIPITKSKYNMKSMKGQMTADEIAKLLLSEDIDPQLVWIYEYINKDGSIDEMSRFSIDMEASKRGFKTRWLKENSIRTTDLRFDRIKIHLTNNNRIKSINIG